MSDTGISRRQFGRRGVLAAAVGGLASVTGGFLAHAQTILPAVVPAQNPASAPTSDDREVEARWQNALAEFGARLNDEQKQRLRTVIAGHVRMLAAVRAFPLTNADAPQTVLKPVGLDASRTAAPTGGR